MLEPLASPHRFSVDEILDWHGSLQRAFYAGDYLLVAQHAAPGGELAGQALILCGMVEQGKGALQSLEVLTPFSELCLAYACWVSNECQRALKVLRHLGIGGGCASIARDLEALVGASSIPIVTIAVALPIYTGEADAVRDARQRFGQFVCTHVGTQLVDESNPDALAMPFSSVIDDLPRGDRPFFIYSGTPQWLLPRDFAACEVPKVVWLHDTDRFFYRMSGNFGLFDVSMTNVSQEHYELTRTCNAFAASNLFCDSMSSPCPEAFYQAEKPLDLVFTGAGLDSPQIDRAHFIANLAELGRHFHVRVFDGHLDEPAFLDLLGSAKFVPIVNRYRGCPSPRWLQALSRGTFVLHPERTTFERFGPGCFPFRPEHMVEDMARHIEQWNDNTLGSPYNAATIFPEIRNALAPRQAPRSALFERTLKCAAMLVLLRRHGFARAVGPNGRQRSVWPVPAMDAWMFGAENILAKTDAMVAWRTQALAEDDDIGINNTAMTLIQQAILLRDRGRLVEAEARYRRALGIVDDGVARFPNSFVLHWNAAHWRMFFEGDVKGARERLLAIGANFGGLSFRPSQSDLGFGFRGADPVFWEYAYGDLVLQAAVRAGNREPDRADRLAIDRLIFSTLHGYLGLIEQWHGEREAALRRYLHALDFCERNAAVHVLALDTCLSLLNDAGTQAGDEIRAAFTSLTADIADINPRLFLSHIGPVLSAASALERRYILGPFLERWWLLRRVIDEPSGKKYFPRDSAEVDALIAVRAHWPLLLTKDVERADTAQPRQVLLRDLAQRL